MGFRISSVVVMAVAAVAASASAQSAGFTLFGNANPDAASVTEERKFVAPVSGPYFHEDSFITTDVRGWFAYQSFPKEGPLNGGSGRDYAVELRLALTDRLQLVANKDGYLDIDSGLLQESGWNDVAAGLKYAVIQDYKNDFHVSVGLGYQFAVGDPSVLQNDQEARAWVSVNKGFDKLHLGATLNYIKHTGNEDALGSSDRITYHLHADYWLNKWVSPVLELNGYHSVNDGNNTPLPFSGADLANLGGGDDLVTLAPGLEIRPTEDLGIRVAYETDLTGGESIFGYRWTFSVIYHF